MASVWARGVDVYPSPLNCSDAVSPAAAQTVEVVSVPAAPFSPVHPPMPDPNVGVAFPDDATANTALSTSISTDAGGTPIMSTRAIAVAEPGGEVTDKELPVSVAAVTSNGSEKIELISVPVSSYQTTCSSVSAQPSTEYKLACHVYAVDGSTVMDSVCARGIDVNPSPLNCSDWVSPE